MSNSVSPDLSFVDAIKICFNKYATFSGRASRAEYWWFVLFNFIVGFICGFISDWVGYAASIALFLPSLAVAVRRLHDIGKGGGWYFLNLIPVIGQIILLIWYVKEGERQPNRFGENPYGINE